MNKEELYEFADKNDINIIDLPIKNLKGIYYKTEDTSYIGLNYNTLINSTEEKCVLAEECGHYSVGVSPVSFSESDYSNLIVNSRNEFRAIKWAIGKLIPLNEFKAFLGTNTANAEVAEALDVTEDFLNKAYYIFKTHGTI